MRSPWSAHTESKCFAKMQLLQTCYIPMAVWPTSNEYLMFWGQGQHLLSSEHLNMLVTGRAWRLAAPGLEAIQRPFTATRSSPCALRAKLPVLQLVTFRGRLTQDHTYKSITSCRLLTCSLVWRIMVLDSIYSRVTAGDLLYLQPVKAGFTQDTKKLVLLKGAMRSTANCPSRSAMSLPTGVPLQHHLEATKTQWQETDCD